MQRLILIIVALTIPFTYCHGQDADSAAADAWAEWMKYAAPGEHHQKLSPMVGTWTITGKFRQTPDGEWSTSMSEGEAEWILGDRFLLSKVRSEPSAMMPDAFEGLGLIGYDNYAQKYVSTWVDNHGTLMLIGEGEASGDTISLAGTYADPITGADKTFRWVYLFPDENRHVMQMYEPLPDGGEFLMGELTYQRATP